MCAILVLALLPFSSYVAAMPFIQDEWGIGNTSAGIVFSAYLAGYAVVSLLVLPLTDRVPLRRVFLISTAVSVVGNALFPVLAFDPITASVLRFLAGAGLVGIYMPGLRLLAQEFPDSTRGVAMGLYVTAYYSAGALSLTATGVLMNSLDWRSSYMALSILSALSIPLSMALVRGRHDVGPSSGGRGLRIGALASGKARSYVLGYSLHAMELYAVRVWLPALLAAALMSRGVEAEQAAVRAATMGGIALAAGAVGPVLGGAMSDRFGRANSAISIFALSGTCCAAIGWTVGAPWPLIVALSCVLGWAIAADSSIYSTAITETADPRQLGSAMALQAFFGFMGGVLGPVFVGVILDVAPQSIQWSFSFTSVALIAVVAIAFLYAISRKSAPPQSFMIWSSCGKGMSGSSSTSKNPTSIASSPGLATPAVSVAA